MSNWKLIALDMDGTLLGKDGDVSSENRTWIEKARNAGIEVTLATGRHIERIRSLSKELGLCVPLVTSNGSEIWTPGGRLLDRHTLAWQDVDFLHELAVQYKTHFWAYTTHQLFSPDTFPSSGENMTWLKFGYYSPEPDVVAELWDIIQKRGTLELSNSHPLNIEVNPRGVTKATGLEKVCNTLGIEQNQVIAMGDSLNDIPMLQWAGLGIAMNNAQDEVKAVAEHVTEHHTRDGVARAIEAILSGKLG